MAETADKRRYGAPIRITIFGATGGTGRELMRQALQAGHEVVAFVRSPEKIGTAHERLTVVKGDVRNRADVEQALDGSAAALSALGVSLREPPVVADGVRNIVLAMRKTGVRRLVVESAYGAGETRYGAYARLLWFVIPSFMKDKEIAEDFLLQQRDIEWVVVRPVRLTNGSRTGTYRTGTEVSVRGLNPTVSRADVAEFMLRQLTDDAYLHQLPTVTYY
ncbi:MAG: SDR family oxidoreductase [bacterium]|nr:SDR family oxidoreductase [bacterium]